MAKKIIIMMIVGFSITSTVFTMLVKKTKSSIFKKSQLGMRNWISLPNGRAMDDENITFRQGHLIRAVGENDIEIATFLLENGERISDECIMQSCSVEMIQLFEKYGTNVRKLYTEDGNFLHHAIRNCLCQEKCIQYLIDKDVDLNGLTKDGDNLWHSLVNAWGYEDEALLCRGNWLRKLGINPHHKNKNKKSAIYMLKKAIAEDMPFRDEMNFDACNKDYNRRCNRNMLLLKIMTAKNFE